MTAWIGPVEVELITPQIRPQVQAGTNGVGAISISLAVEWWQAHQLQELVDNPARRPTIGGITGVLEPVWFSDELLGPLTGLALLQSCEIQADQEYSLAGTTGLVPVSLTLASLGDDTYRKFLLSRSARAKVSSFVLAPDALIVNPFWDEDADGSAFVVDPGGTRFTREYDATSPHSTSRLARDSRQQTIYAAPFVTGADPFDLVAHPTLAQSFTGPPGWVTDRGGDCRGFDRRLQYEIYGPAHRLTEPSDLIVTNGLIRGTVGPAGLPPFLRIEAFASGDWVEEGYLYLADPSSSVMRSCRLVTVTPDLVTVAFSVQGAEEWFVSLRRGARRFDAQNALRLQWHGLPPWLSLTSASNGTGKFGNGLAASSDVTLRWPQSLAESEWSACWWITAASNSVDVSLGAALSLIANDGTSAGDLLYDGAFTFSLGAGSVASTTESFSAGDDLFVCLRFSTTKGMALSIGTTTIAHFKDATDVDPGSVGPYRGFFFGGSSTSAGDGTAGDGVAGGLIDALGVSDNLMLFETYLSDDRVAALFAATNRLDGLGDDEGSMVWYFPADVLPVPLASAVSNGVIYEATASGGSTRNPDANGYTKAVAALVPGSLSVGLGLTGVNTELSAYLATTAAEDDLANHQAQFAAASTQKVWVS